MRLIAIIAILSLLNCKTINKKEELQEMRNKTVTEQISLQNINAENFVEQVASRVKRYKWEPLYYLRIGKANCLIEIFVNDMPVYKSYSLSNLASPLKINKRILKTGTHTVTVRMYPVGDLIKEAYDYGETVTHLGDASSVSVKVVRYNNQGDMGFDDEFEVKSHQSPTKDANGEVFAGCGLTYFEYSFEFHADVPYNLSENSWGNAADLRKVKKEYLNDAVYEYYQNYIHALKNNKKDYIAQKDFIATLVQAQAYYNTEEEVQEIWDETTEFMNNPSLEPQPITNYELIFYADGEVCQLRHKNPSDKRLRNKSSAWVLYKNNDREGAMFYNLYLYCNKKSFNKKDLKLRQI
ncbi:MAG: hypothetical protein JKY08_06080 [Flavobacteriaceae bacterium]|nr:hypothetical protein [Flavobacteriaceae bacterium]